MLIVFNVMMIGKFKLKYKMENNKSTAIRSFTLEQYSQMAIKLNKMTFHDKIITLQKNSDILALGSDGNWWAVRVKDEDVDNKLNENEEGFEI